MISECAPGESFLVSLHIVDLCFPRPSEENSRKRNEIREMFSPMEIKSTLHRVYNDNYVTKIENKTLRIKGNLKFKENIYINVIKITA